MPVSIRDFGLECIRTPCSYILLTCLAYIISANGTANTRSEPLRDTAVVKMVAAVDQAGGRSHRVLTDGTHTFGGWRRILLYRLLDLLRGRDNRHWLMKRPHHLGCQINREIGARNNAHLSRGIGKDMNDIQHQHCLAITIGDYAITHRLRETRSSVEEECLALYDITQQRNDGRQHTL